MSNTSTSIPSPNGSIVAAGNGTAIIDTNGNTWTISSTNAVLENGQAAAFSANVAEIAYVSKTVWQENKSNQWYSWTGSGWSAGNDPLPIPTPTPTPTPTGKEITPTSGGTLTDASGNKWTLTSAGVVDENGTAVPGGSGTAAFAIVGNSYYGQDAATRDWYTYSPASHSWTSSAAPVLTPTPTPTPNPNPDSDADPPPDATPAPNEITATSGGTLTDASGNKWTLTSAGVVDENGTAVPGSSGTSAFAIVSNVYYGQDAASKAWFTYSPTSRTWTGSAAPILTPTPTPTPTPSPPGTRDPSQVPFASTSVFNLPLGSGAQWTPNAQLASASVYVNTTAADITRTSTPAPPRTR